jgi:hypothetical protein
MTKNAKQILLRGYKLDVAYKRTKSIKELLRRVALV